MRILCCAAALIAALMLAMVTPLRAQVTETPQAFDSNGRVMVVTPSLASRAGLGPPEWSITGDYSEARLYQRSGGGYVIVVTRRTGMLERYDVMLADVNAIRNRIDALPPTLTMQPLGNAASAFVRNQTLMGLTIYAPALATALADETAGNVSTYLLTAGATFFAATQLSREMTITHNMNSLATHMGIRGALLGEALTYAFGLSGDQRAGGVFAGGIAGSAAGLLLGKRWSEQEGNGSKMTADFLAVTGIGVTHIVRGNRDEPLFLTRGEAAVISGLGITGYVLGRAYGESVSHGITIGDTRTLWISGALGAAAGSIPVAGGGASERVEALSITAGYVLGVAAGELLLSRRFDLSESDASLMGLGALAGGAVGLGIDRLTDRSGETDARTMTLTTLGGIGGLFLTHFMLAPALDAGNPLRTNGGGPGGSGARFELNPSALALSVAGLPGKFPILSVNFR